MDTSNVEYKMDAAAAVIIRLNQDDDRQVLIIQRAKEDKWPNHWEFPRGKCDVKGEDLFGCLKREVKEEVGLDVEIVRLVDTHQYTADEGKRLTTCHNFLCKMVDDEQEVKLSHEHQRFKWIGEVGQAELILLPEQKKTIEKVLNRGRALVSSPGDKKEETIKEYLRYIQRKGLC
ncbi:MAG: NUDIX hydrolase [Candidatus Heimdallarchaeaceae archaeon]